LPQLKLACAAGLLGLAAAPATATARALPGGPDQAPQSAVALAFDSTGSGFAFYRGTDHAVYMRTPTRPLATWPQCAPGRRRLG
jgi:hypothetical protein